MKRFAPVLLAACMLAPAARADSIWARRTPRGGFLFVDTRARRVGDVVTIAIVENTDIANKDQRNASKTSSLGGNFTLKGNITGTSQTATRSAAASYDTLVGATRAFNGASAYSVAQLFTDRVSAVVVAVEPNGNLIVEAFRTRIIGREVRRLRLTGIIRPIDIDLTNVVQSPFVANLQIQYMGKGDQSAFTTPGWIGHMINYLWPF